MRHKDLKIEHFHRKNRMSSKSVKPDKYNIETESPELNQNNFDSNLNSKMKAMKKFPQKNSQAKPNFGDHYENIDNVTQHGSLKQYCIKGNEVILRDIHYIKNEKSRMLMINVDNKQHQTDTYTILFTKDVCPFTFKDTKAFVLKVIDIKKKLKSMTFQSSKDEDKKMWIDHYGLNMNIGSDLLNICINEVERRRFQLGVKKRSEEKSKLKVDIDLLEELFSSLSKKQTVDLNNETKWTVGNLERLIQLLLNELPQPLIVFTSQRNLRRSDHNEPVADQNAKQILTNLPTINRSMLTALLNHMERLSKYYLIIMSSPKKILPQIRRNICKRLSPIIFRIQHDVENETTNTRCSELLFNIMIHVNNTTDNYE